MCAPGWTSLCDFDGTISVEHVIDSLLDRFGHTGWEVLEQDWRAGRRNRLRADHRLRGCSRLSTATAERQSARRSAMLQAGRWRCAVWFGAAPGSAPPRHAAARGRHAFNEQWRMYANTSGVKKNGGRLDGHIVNAALGLEWFPWQHVGVGAEYGYSRIVLRQRKHDYHANLDMKLDGPSLFVRLRF